MQQSQVDAANFEVKKYKDTAKQTQETLEQRDLEFAETVKRVRFQRPFGEISSYVLTRCS
jgi:hypothetical protein